MKSLFRVFFSEFDASGRSNLVALLRLDSRLHLAALARRLRLRQELPPRRSSVWDTESNALGAGARAVAGRGLRFDPMAPGTDLPGCYGGEGGMDGWGRRSCFFCEGWWKSAFNLLTLVFEGDGPR